MQVKIIKKNDGTVIAAGTLGVDVIHIEDGWYFPPSAVNTAGLHLTERTYTCPYKGVCNWIDMEEPGARAQNIAWVYPKPKAGYEAITDYIAFSTRDTSVTMAVYG